MPSCEEDGGFDTEGGLESRGDEEEGRETLKFHRGVSPTAAALFERRKIPVCVGKVPLDSVRLWYSTSSMDHQLIFIDH